MTTIKELKAHSLYCFWVGSVMVIHIEQSPSVMHLNKYKWIYRTNTKIYKMHAILTDLLLFCCRSKTILDSCPYLSILALHWYPQQINGHKFEGKEGDYIRVPERLLDVPDAEIISGKSTCELVQFIEYSSQQWFINENNLPVLKNKVIYYYKDL